jgi:hypothetical protein
MGLVQLALAIAGGLTIFYVGLQILSFIVGTFVEILNGMFEGGVWKIWSIFIGFFMVINGVNGLSNDMTSIWYSLVLMVGIVLLTWYFWFKLFKWVQE